MKSCISELKLNKKQHKLYKILKRKIPVSYKFLSQNIHKIKKYLLYSYSLHGIIYRKYAIRNKHNRVIIHYRKFRGIVFEPKNLKWIKLRQKNVRRWSAQVVSYLKSIGRITQYEEMEVYDSKSSTLPAEEVSKQLKEQLELLKSGKRVTFLRESFVEPVEPAEIPRNDDLVADHTATNVNHTEITPEKQKLCTNGEVEAPAPAKLYKQNHTEKSMDSLPLVKAANTENVPSNGSNFLDMLMNKVRVKTFANVANFDSQQQQEEPLIGILSASTCNDETKGLSINEVQDDSCEEEEEFVGFDESTHQPGMMLTPLVPKSSMTVAGNAAFVSESLNEYMRQNNLCESNEEPPCNVKKKTVEQVSLEGLVTPGSEPPHMEMPAVPESLQKLRTVAKRREYLQKFPKTHKMVLINNEANIYRELQRKIRQQKVKAASMQMLQSPSTQMPFTRNGWQAASYVATDNNKYYYQTINVDGEMIKLTGTMGNNDQREKKPYLSRVKKSPQCCGADCVDAMVWRDFKIIKSKVNKAKLNKLPLPPVFRPCPLSHKAYQKPLDDDTAALLLAGGSMAVVSMPTVELQVFPETGKPLNEIAKRYLEYILPHHDISSEWAKFSVSTLREANKTSAAGQRKSFTFAIPYINDRNQILVRRVVDRSEKLDESFEQAQIQDTPSLLNDLSFRADVNPKDRLQMECADVLSDMINCVAISCSENSFIREDPDGLKIENKLNGDIIKVAIETKQQNGETSMQDIKRNDNKTTNGKHNPALRQQRLRLELRRLNATIIETAAKNDKDNKPCTMPYCQFGCVCDSKAGAYPLREHCGKATCILECFCKSKNLSRIVRLETDGCGISNEDAFMLRRKATARLAPMEKEFTSTVVLTENETLLINESQRDKKRRCTKAPKRYEDFADTDDDFLHASPKKSHTTQHPSKGSVMAIDTLDPSMPKSSSISKIMDLREPCSIREQDFDKLKHCTIPLRRLPDMSNVVPLCMTHQLYKCFCDGKALEGRPVVLDKEVANPASCPKITYATLPPAKASYSFDKVERSIDNRKYHQSSFLKDNAAKAKESSSTQTNVVNHKLLEVSKVTKNKESSAELEVISKYMNVDQNICRRAVAIPSKCFTILNNKRKLKVSMYASNSENDETQEKLLRHMHEASVHYRKEIENERIRKKNELLKVKKRLNEETTTNVIELQDDDDDENVPSCAIQDSNKTSLPTTLLSAALAGTASSSSSVQSNSLMKRKKPTNLEDITKQTPAKKMPKLLVSSNKSGRSLLKSENLKRDSSNSIKLQTNNDDLKIQVPRIAACYSLSTVSSDNVLSSPVNQMMSSPVASPVAPKSDVSSSSAIQIRCGETVASETCQPNYKDFYQDVVKNMNSLVSKKMQDIDMALQRDSKLIPAPNEEILCIIKWTNFLDAFESGFVFIWDVKMRNYSFLAATVNNMMPIVCGAVGVVNIVGLRPANLPLLAQNLLQHNRTKFTERLAIVMQGRKHYWVVKGHLLHTVDNACTRPTPQTHPLLTKKINLLCSQLVKQRIREKQRKQQVAAQVSSLPTVSPSAPTILMQTTPPPLIASSVSQARSQTTGAELKRNTPPPHTSISSQRGTNESNVFQRELSADQPPPTPQDHTSLKIKSNIEFRSVSQGDIDQLMLPERHNEDHRWLVLELHNDFSHIFVPAFRDMISLDRIHNVMAVARDKNKIVKLQFFQNAPYDAFVTPASKCKIYFGPLKLNMTPPLLVLLQSVDGKMMLREVYQRQHSIFINPENRTTAFWVLYVNGEISFEIGVGSGEGGDNGKSTPNSSSLSLLKQPPPSLPGNQLDAPLPQNDSDSDDDCMIIDDDPHQSTSLMHPTFKPSMQTTEHQQRLNFSIQQVAKDNLSVIQISPALAISPATSTSISDPTPASLPSNMLRLPAIANATTPVTSEMGFVPLGNSIPGNAIISVAPTSSSYIISPVASTTAATNKPTKRLAKVLTNVQQTYLTPDVQMTSTTEPESFTETPPSKISRISISTSARINNNKGIKQTSSPQTQSSVSKDSSAIEIQKTTVGCTTITRLNDGNRMSPTIGVKDVLNINSIPTTGILNGKDIGPQTVVVNGIKSKQATSSSSNSTANSSTTLTLDVSKNTTFTSANSTKVKKLSLPLTAAEVGKATKSTLANSVKVMPKPDGSGKQNQNYSIQIGQQQQASIHPSVTTSLTGNVIASKAKRPLLPDGGTINNTNEIRLQQHVGGRRIAPTKINQMGSSTSNTKKDGPASNSTTSLFSKLKLPSVPSESTDTKTKNTSVKYKKQHKDTISTNMNLVEFDDHRYDHDDDDDDDNEKMDTNVTINNKTIVSFEYGYVWAPQMPKFVVKIVDNEYLIKVPKVGILRMKGMNEVEDYLNSHCIDKSKVPADWKYYLQKRVTQIRQTTEKEMLQRSDRKSVTITSSSNKREFDNTSISIGVINSQDSEKLESSKKTKTYEEISSINSILIED